jgi:hypothetical protein
VPRARRSALLLAAAALAAGCGYRLSTHYEALGGARAIHVRTFENLSTEPALGAVVTAALRGELSRRGAAAGEGAPAFIDGDVRATAPTPSVAGAAGTATFRIGIEVRGRLVLDGAAVAERSVRRETDYLAGTGGDALESEGRRALALRRAAEDAARELVASFER